jgi:pilus assembly protein CpaF
MSLADRLAAAKRERGVAPAEAALGDGEFSPAAPRIRRTADPFAELKRTVHQTLLDNLGPKLYDSRLTQSELEQKVRQTLQEVLAQEETPLTVADRAKIAQEIADDILGYGPLEPYLRDTDITEVMVNGFDQIYIERSGRIHNVDGAFSDEAHLRRTIDKIVAKVGRRVDESSPMVDARLPDGSRVNAVIPPLAIDGSLLTIRKFSADPYMVEDLIGFGTMTRTVSDLLESCVRGKLNILVSGGTSCRRSFLAKSGSSPSRMPPSSSCTRSTCYAWKRDRRTSRVAARSRFVTWCATPFACGLTASSSARSVTRRLSTCFKP